jgi:fructokinase
MPVITCFGETLWDIFPDKKKIGGAPLNVACRLHSLGSKVHLISRVGKDHNGNQILKFLQHLGLISSGIQIDDQYPTGVVNVHLDNSNTASYTIEKPAAWDFISIDDEVLYKIKSSDALIFGSLVCRSETSKNTLFTLLEQPVFKVFDANLRPPHYSLDLILELMKKADFIKLNDEELKEICEFVNIRNGSIKEQLLELSKRTQSKHICVTLGKNGALLLTDNQLFKNDGYAVKVKDTVGAGDSFLAALIHLFLLKKQPQHALDYSCAVGSLVASKSGANEPITEDDIQRLLSHQV